MTERQPRATGTLAVRPLAHLLVYLLERKLTGTLVLQAPDADARADADGSAAVGGAKSAVYFREGIPLRIKTSEQVIHLGRLLVEEGKLDIAALNASLTKWAKVGGLHGRLLVAEGLIDEETLAAALREQAGRKMGWLFGLPTTTQFGFYPDEDLISGWGGPKGTPVSPLAALWRGVRQNPNAADIEAALMPLAGRRLRLHPDAQLAAFEFKRDALSIIDLIRASPKSMDDLAGASLLAPLLLERLIYVLVISRQLDTGVGAPVRTAPLEAAAPPSSRPAEGFRPPPASRRAPRPATGPPAAPILDEVDRDSIEVVDDLRRRLEQSPSQTYYELLGVPPGAPKSAIQSAFLTLAKDWHPDRLPPVLADYRELAAKLFSRYTAAHQVLSDEGRRAAYGAELEKGGVDEDERVLVEHALRATTYFQKAEVLLRKNDLAGAREFARLAMEHDPDQVDYLAIHCWAEAHDPERVKAQRYDDLVKMLGVALKGQENHKQARMYRALLLKRCGRVRESMKDFRWLAENDRHNVEARREIRLYDMRRKTRGDADNSSEAPPSGDKSRGSQTVVFGADVGALFSRFRKKTKKK